jgi:hypothetical protein
MQALTFKNRRQQQSLETPAILDMKWYGTMDAYGGLRPTRVLTSN